MDIQEFWRENGTDATKALAVEAGTSFKYLEHFINYRRCPSVRLAHRLIKASGNKLTLEEVLLSEEERAKRRAQKSADDLERQELRRKEADQRKHGICVCPVCKARINTKAHTLAS